MLLPYTGALVLAGWADPVSSRARRALRLEPALVAGPAVLGLLKPLGAHERRAIEP